MAVNQALSNGGNAVVRRYGTAHMANIGRAGGKAVVSRYGTRFYSLIGQLANPTITQRQRSIITNQIDRIVSTANR